MVTGNLQEDVEKKSKGINRSWGTTVSGQSVSTSGRVGSPSSRSEAGMATPVRDITALRLSNLANQGDDSASQRARRKKRGERATDNDKNDRGLRHLSMKVCEKVKSKGRTTYNEVADELVAEYASIALGTEGDDKKNIRRRVYDALNVLTAMHIISKDKKEIQWRGFPQTSSNHIEELKTERVALEKRIEKKAAYLRELEEQFTGYANLIQRNQQLYGNGTAPSGHVTLPFLLAQTRADATVEMEISEDMKLVHIDFNSTPFKLHDDNFVLKHTNFCQKPQLDSGVSNPPASTGDNTTMPKPNTYHPRTLLSSSSSKPCHALATQPL